jgi:hypothetical protein
MGSSPHNTSLSPNPPRRLDVPSLVCPYRSISDGTSAWCFEEAADLGCKDIRFAAETTVGDANRLVSADLASDVLGPIALERGPMTMERIAVELDDYALVGPEGIDLVAEHFDIGLKRRKALLATKASKAMLQLRARPNGLVRLVNQATDRPLCTAAATPSIDILQLTHLQQAKAVRLFPRPLELSDREDFRKVEQRACDGGDWDSVNRGAIDVMDAAFVDQDSRPAPPNRRGDLNRARPRLRQAPEGRSRTMAQERSLSAREHSRDPSTAQTHISVAEGKHLAVHPRKSARFEASPDRPQAQSCHQQLMTGENPVLLSREGGELALAPDQRSPPPLVWTCRRLCAHIGLQATARPDSPPPRRRETRNLRSG